MRRRSARRWFAVPDVAPGGKVTLQQALETITAAKTAVLQIRAPSARKRAPLLD
jgi:hypothetical protein